jgi:hypothetical protein
MIHDDIRAHLIGCGAILPAVVTVPASLVVKILWTQVLLHAFFRVPGTLQAANINNLPDVIRIVRSDVSNF